MNSLSTQHLRHGGYHLYDTIWQYILIYMNKNEPATNVDLVIIIIFIKHTISLEMADIDLSYHPIRS